MQWHLHFTEYIPSYHNQRHPWFICTSLCRFYLSVMFSWSLHKPMDYFLCHGQNIAVVEGNTKHNKPTEHSSGSRGKCQSKAIEWCFCRDITVMDTQAFSQGVFILWPRWMRMAVWKPKSWKKEDFFISWGKWPQKLYTLCSVSKHRQS